MTGKRRHHRRIRPLRRLTALFAAIAILACTLQELSLTTEAASGCWRWRFRVVRSDDYLPTADDWFPVLLLYKYNGVTYIMDSAEHVTIDGMATGEVKFKGVAPYYDANEDYVASGFNQYTNGNGLPDTYNGDFPYGIWMKYAGTDSKNDNSKMYYIRDTKNSGGIYGSDGFVDYESARSHWASLSIPENEMRAELKGRLEAHSAVGEIDKQLYSAFTIFTAGYHDTSSEKVKIVQNLSGGKTDYSFHVDGGYVTLSDHVSSFSYAYDEFTMFVGERFLDSSYRSYSSLTVETGVTTALGDSYIELGGKVVVKEGGTLIIKGRVYFDGTIENYGTIIVEDGTLEATHFLTGTDDQTVYGCYKGYQGSSLIVLAGCVVYAGGDTTASGYNYGRRGTGIELYGGSLINNGSVAAPFGIHLEGSAEIVNGTNGKLFVGYYPMPKYIGSMTGVWGNILWLDGVVEAWKGTSKRGPAVVSCTWSGDQYPIIRNSGQFWANCGWVNSNGSAPTELSSADTAKILIQKTSGSYTQSSNWALFKTGSRYSAWLGGTAALW